MHVKGTVRNGCTREEIREALMRTAVYCGFPPVMGSFKVAREALDQMEAAAAP